MLFTLLQAAPAGQPGGMSQLLPLMLIMVVFFFFMIWPQMRKQKKAKAYLAELKKGDHVVTTGGFHAKISQITDTHFILELEEGKIKALKGFVDYVKRISKMINKKAFLKNKVSNRFTPTIGFSDDDLRNLEKVKGHFEKDPENIIKTISTHGGIKKPY